jgi:hypothetical protein
VEIEEEFMRIDLRAAPLASTMSRRSTPSSRDVSHEERAATDYFQSRAADALSRPNTAASIKKLADAGVDVTTASWKEQSACEAYLDLSVGGAEELCVRRASVTVVRARREDVEANPRWADPVLDRVKRFDRFLAVRADARDVLKAVDAVEGGPAGRPMAERESAMLEILRIPSSWRRSGERMYRAVTEEARDGESLVDTARQYRAFIDRCPDADERGWSFYRSLDERRDVFPPILAVVSDEEAAERAFAAITADRREDRFEARRSALAAMMKALPNSASAAVATLETFLSTVRPPESEDAALAHGAELLERIGDAEAVCAMRTTLPAGPPAEMSLADKERWFGGLLQYASATEIAAAWTDVATAQRLALVHRMLEAGRSFSAALADVKKMDEDGGQAARLLDVTPTYEDAQEAARRLSRASRPADPAAREEVFRLVAAPRPASDDFIDRAMDDFWYVNRVAATRNPVDAAEAYAKWLRAAGGDSEEARVLDARVRAELHDGGPLGVDLAHRERWLVAALESTVPSPSDRPPFGGDRDAAPDADDAWRILAFVERAGSAAAADDRAASIGSLVRIARHFQAADPVAEACRLHGELADGGRPTAAAARALEAVAARLPDRAGLDRLRATLLIPGRDLARDLVDLGPLLDACSRPADAIEAWPTLRDTRPDLDNRDKIAAVVRVVRGYDDPRPVFSNLARGASDGAALRRHAEALARLRGGGPLEDAMETYRAIERAAGDRMEPYLRLVEAGASTATTREVAEAVREPFGGESVGDRERAFFALYEGLGGNETADRDEAAKLAVLTLRTIGAGGLPGDRLEDLVRPCAALQQALSDGVLGRDVMGRILAERLDGLWLGVDVDALVVSFLECRAVDGNVDRAFEAMRRSARGGTIQTGPDDVVVGGIRVPKRPEDAGGLGAAISG